MKYSSPASWSQWAVIPFLFPRPPQASRTLYCGSLIDVWGPVRVFLNCDSDELFWTPHLQIFNIFIPIASLYLFWWMQPRLRTLTWRHVIAIGLLLGLGNLAYGAFAMTAAGAVLCILLGDGVDALRTLPGPRERCVRRSSRRHS